MNPDEDSTADSASRRTSGEAIEASGAAKVYRAGRDQHIYFADGVRDRRRTVPGPVVSECPYPGLAAFGPQQAAWFFGRDTLIADLIARLDQRVTAGGVQVVVAPSGAGKSSLLRAGLLPRLDQAALPGSDRWPKLVLTPTADPSQWLPTLRGQLAARDPHSRIVVVVDQFEELFTLCTNDQQRHTFIDVLTQLADPGPDMDPVGLVVLGIRADFFPACVNDPRLRAALQDVPLVVGPMSEEELREAIRYPAQDVGLDIEPGLEQVLLRDLGASASGYEAGRLPLLAHALRVSWQQRNGTTLTVQGYQDTGGIQHAIATTADRIYTRLDKDGQQIAQRLFMRLIKIGDGTEDTRRRVPHAELISADPSQVMDVLQAFTAARLLTQEKDTVEITHAALLLSWPLLRSWIDTDRAGRLTRQNLEEAAVAWDRGQRDPSLLYRGSRLEVAHTWATSTAASDDLSPVARAFLTAGTRARRRSTRWRTMITAVLTVLTVVASTAAVIAFQQQHEALRQRDLALYNRVLADADRLRGSDASLSAQLDLVAHRMRPGDDTYTRLVTAGNAPLSTLLVGHTTSVDSVAFTRDGHTLATASGDRSVRLWNTTDPTRPAVLGRIDHSSAISTLAFSPDGRILATGSRDFTAQLWNVADLSRPTPLGRPMLGHSDSVLSVAFSPDGHTLATAGSDQTIRLWNVTDPVKPTLLGQPTRRSTSALSLAFSPDGHTLATGNTDRTVRLGNITDPTAPTLLGQPLTGQKGSITTVAFSPDGHTLATGSNDFTVQLWNVADPARPVPVGERLGGDIGDVKSVAFSPDGHILATGSADSTVRLWDVTDPARHSELGQPLFGHTNSVLSVAFSPDGHTLATGSADSTARLWNLPRSLLTGHIDSVSSVAFSPNGHMLATGSADHSVRLWDVIDSTAPSSVGQPLTGHTDVVYSVVFSPDGRILATGSLDNSARLWSLTDPVVPTLLGQPLTGHTNSVWSVRFSPDGRTLVAASGDRSIRLWNITDPTKPTSLSEPLVGHASAVLSVAFSPDRRTLASASTDATVRLWDVSYPSRPGPLGQPMTGHTDYVWTVAFSPDGHILASAGNDRSVRLWNVTDPAHPTPLGQPLTGPTDVIYSVAFSPDGHTLAAGSADHSVWLWNISDTTHPTPKGVPLTGHTDAIFQAAFSPDGRTLATGSADQSVRLWQLNVDRDIERICTITRTALTPEEWKRYVGDDIPYNPPCT